MQSGLWINVPKKENSTIIRARAGISSYHRQGGDLGLAKRDGVFLDAEMVTGILDEFKFMEKSSLPEVKKW